MITAPCPDTSTHRPLEDASSAMAFTEAVLEALTSATWPDGTPLIDVHESVLRRELSPKLLDAASALAAVTLLEHLPEARR